jgi:hypothetical protein
LLSWCIDWLYRHKTAYEVEFFHQAIDRLFGM